MCSAVSVVQCTGVQTRTASAPKSPNNLNELTSRIEELAAELRKAAFAERPKSVSNAHLVVEAQKIYRFRRKVDEIFDHDGFSKSPVWDIMLDLFEGNSKGRGISVSSAGIGAACPSTTALRCLGALEKMGLITRCCDPDDKRRVMIVLTQDGLQKTTAALRARFEV